MLKHLHPFTWLSLGLAVSASALWAGGALEVVPFFLLAAHVAALAEFKKYTSWFQFTMILVSAAGLGLFLDVRSGHAGLATIPLVLSAGAIILRQAYMPRFTYVNFLWVEPVLLLVSGFFMVAVWRNGPFRVDSHLFPLVTMASGCFLSASYLQDAVMMRRRTRFGYRVQSGTAAPDFVLSDQEGNSVHLADYRGKHPVLLIFVRGDWCPGCHMMLRTYERYHEKFKARGIHVLGIGPDSVDVNKDMVERIGVGYRLLSDPGQQVAQRFGVIYENPAIESMVDYAEGIPLPASFLVDVSGMVRYVSRPDRVGEFLDPTLIFGVLDRLPELAADDSRAA